MKYLLNQFATLALLAGYYLSTALPLVVAADAQPTTGPETEKRFPPLTLPEGFHATLFACDPLIEYPSVIALGPEPGTLFVAYDYMTGLGIEIIRRDEIRIVRDRDGDGYADESTLYADGFNSIQGLTYHAGSVFVMHAPFLTSLTDTNGDGVADQRRDLLQGLGLPPEQNDNRLHCANGVAAGHDGWLYLALGDRGCDVLRPEGDRLLFQEGGILRCRPDGRDLHVLSSGLRNIYDVALDEELNVFVRDNENDGGDYMIRVCHCFHGSDHGYPYLYNERPVEAMRPLADLGRGSSAGGTTYLEPAFPPEYRESLFFCEWGRAVVRYHKQQSGSGFAPVQEVDFAATAPNDPYGFKPTDLVVDRDGSLLISDWGDGQRPKRGRGRIYRITYEGGWIFDAATFSANSTFDELIGGLNSPSYHMRCAAQEQFEYRGVSAMPALREALKQDRIHSVGRLHAIWILAHVQADESLETLFPIARSDSDSNVRAQAIRAIADLVDPVLKFHRLQAGRGDEAVGQQLAAIAESGDERIKLEVLVALGRLRWSSAPQWLSQHWSHADATLAHAVQQLLRRSDNWPEVVNLLNNSATSGEETSLRTIALQALANQAHETIVDGLLERLQHEEIPQRRAEYFDLLTRVYNKPAAWTYWGFRPAPRPANSVAWDRTEVISTVLDQALADPELGVRAKVARRMLREQIPIRLDALTKWLETDITAEGVAAILEAFRPRPATETRDALEGVWRSKEHVDANRLTALAMLTREMDAEGEHRILRTAKGLDEGPVLAATMRALAKRPNLQLSAWLVSHIRASNDEVRATVAESLAQSPDSAVTSHVVALLADHDVRVRRAAAKLAGKLLVRDSADLLLAAAAESDPQLSSASLESLRMLEDARAVAQAVAALNIPEAQLAACRYLGRFGSPEYVESVLGCTERSRAADVLIAAVNALVSWQSRDATTQLERTALDQAIARIHGTSGVPILWRVRGPLAADAAQVVLDDIANPDISQSVALSEEKWTPRILEDADGRVQLASTPVSNETTWLAASDLVIEQIGEYEISATTKSPIRMWLNGRQLMEESASTTPPSDSHRFGAALTAGHNRLLLELLGKETADFQVRLRRKSSKAEHERLTNAALAGGGSSERGREVFLNADKSQCVKCHRLDAQGGRIGPDLAGIGSRFSRMHLVEALLEPSRTVAPSYETVVVALMNGLVLSGVKTAESESHVVLGDNQGKLIEIAKSDIDELQSQPRSTMPDGLEQRLTEREFLDLIEFLVSQKKASTE